MIIEYKNKNDVNALVHVLHKSFKTVADEMGLTKKNTPSNAAFVNNKMIINQINKQIKFFCYVKSNKLIGCIAIEKSKKEKGTFYIEKLAVLPEYRHLGIGKQLMGFAVSYIVSLKGNKAAIGIIDENILLKKWYKTLGFVEKERKAFGHLPFLVCFMEKRLFL